MVEIDRQQRRELVKDRLRQIGIGAAGVIIGFLIGYVAQIGAKRSLQATIDTTRQELEAVRAELQLHGLQTRVGAAMAETQRGNYERGRQLMSSFYQELEAMEPAVTDGAVQAAIRQTVAERDNMITLLSRAAPESAQRLTLLYTRLYPVFDAFGRESPGMVTPAPPDTGGTGSAQ